MFDWLNHGIGYIIRFCSSLVNNNYGLALLVFAFITKLILFPFGIKQQKNMVIQAKLRPKEMAIMKKYAGRNDKATMQKMQEEKMNLYNEEKFNPMSGCLPLLIQFPILFALYEVIRNPLTYICQFSKTTIEAIKGQIPDIAEKIDEIQLIGKMEEVGLETFNSIPDFNSELIPDFGFLGDIFNLSITPSTQGLISIYILIPILTFVFTFFAGKINKKLSYQAPMAGDAANNSSMKIMEYSMPLLSTYFAYIMPAALGFYWMYNNIFSVLQQVVLYKLYPYPKFTEEDYKAAEKAIGAEKKTKKKSSGTKNPNVVSLHHIDDDEFEEIYCKKKKEDTVTTHSKSVTEEEVPAPIKEETENKNIPVIKDDEKTKYKKKD